MNRKAGIIFPGQGSQYENMGRELIEGKDPVYSAAMEVLDDDIFTVISKAEKEDLSKTRYAQLAIFLNSMALYRKLVEKGIEPCGFLGLSLGEYSALCAAGRIELKDAVDLIRKRSIIMEKGASGKGTMAAVMKTDLEKIDEIMDISREDGEVISICNINSPNQTVIGGSFKSVENFEKNAALHGVKKVVRLDVEGPFHTEILKESSDVFRKELEKVDFIENKNRVYSNFTGKRYDENPDYVELLSKQMYNKVNFQSCVEEMIKDGCELFIEVGPGKALSNFVRKTDRNVTCISIQNIKDIEKADIQL